MTEITIDSLSFFIKISNTLNQSNCEQYTYIYGNKKVIDYIKNKIEETMFKDILFPEDLLFKKIKIISEKVNYHISLSETSGLDNHEFINYHMKPFGIKTKEEQIFIEKTVEKWIKELIKFVGEDNVFTVNIDITIVEEHVAQFSIQNQSNELFKLLEKKRMQNELESSLDVKEMANKFKV